MICRNGVSGVPDGSSTSQEQLAEGEVRYVLSRAAGKAHYHRVDPALQEGHKGPGPGETESSPICLCFFGRKFQVSETWFKMIQL